MQRHLAVLIAALVLSASAKAQDTLRAPAAVLNAPPSGRAWVTRHDAYGAGASIVAIGLLSLADEAAAKVTQRQSLQSNDFLHNSTRVIQSVGDPGALALSATLYVAGRVTHHPALADASKHAVMSIALSSVATQSLKLSVGRARPNITDDRNAHVFHLFHGAKTDYNSFPSGHATAAFAAAGAFSAELARSHPKASRIARPVLYGFAALVGGARMYNNRHWLSDVVTGALIGEVTARRVVKLTHEE